MQLDAQLLTPEEALGKAREIARNPASVVPFAHAGLETAHHGRGWAFRQVIAGDLGDADGYVLVGAEGGHASGVLGEGKPIEAVIAAHLDKAAHDHRDIIEAGLGVPQRVALLAFAAGNHLDLATVDYARYLLIMLQRGGKSAFVREDGLLRPPEPGRQYTHGCPICGHPAVHMDRYPRSVCDGCHERTVDRNGLRVVGSNVGFSGGFVAHYADHPRVRCVEVTQTGQCWIDGHEARMGEARFGGIVVEAV